MSERFMAVPVTVARRGRQPIVRVGVMAVIMAVRMLVLERIMTVRVFMHLPVFQKQDNRHNQYTDGDRMQ